MKRKAVEEAEAQKKRNEELEEKARALGLKV
jgi:hypothetical protein